MAGRVKLFEQEAKLSKVKDAREVEATFASWRAKYRRPESVFSVIVRRGPHCMRQLNSPHVGAGVWNLDVLIENDPGAVRLQGGRAGSDGGRRHGRGGPS